MTTTPGPRHPSLDADTTTEAAETQERLFRGMGPAGRMRACIDLSESVVESTRRALRRRRPGASDREIDLAFIEACYGADLAREVDAHLRSR